MRHRPALFTAVLLLLFLGGIHVAQGDDKTASKPDLKPFVEEVRKLVEKHYPKAKVTLKDQTIHFEFNTRTFMIHEPLLRGEWQDAREEPGPQKSGIYGDIELRAGEYGGMAIVPQSFDKRYFTLLLMAPYSKKLDHHLYIHLKYPRNPHGKRDGRHALVGRFVEGHLALAACSGSEPSRQPRHDAADGCGVGQGCRRYSWRAVAASRGRAAPTAGHRSEPETEFGVSLSVLDAEGSDAAWPDAGCVGREADRANGECGLRQKSQARNPEGEAMTLVAWVQFVDGMRRVYEDELGQFIFDDVGERFYGVWYIPTDECDIPLTVAVGPTT
jgi:hypothetical protein